GKHDAPNRVVAVELFEGRDKAVHELVRERVQPPRAVHRDDSDLLLALDFDEISRSAAGGAGTSAIGRLRRAYATTHRSRNFRIASCASSFSIESASQSRACPTVSCQETSRHQLSCCFAYRVVCGSFAASFSTSSSTVASS